MSRILEKLQAFTKDEHGTSTLEFIIVFPAFLGVILATFDSGLVMTKYVVLENALDRVVREVRLTGSPGSSGGSVGHATFKAAVCDIATIITNCETDLHVEMIPVDTSASFIPDSTAACVDRSTGGTPLVVFTPGAENEIVFLRACLVVDRYFPSMVDGLFASNMDAGKGIQLVASSAYVTEPS